MNKVASILILSAIATPAFARDVQVASPDGNTVVTIGDSNGAPVYSVSVDGKTLIQDSPLGFTANLGDFTKATLQDTETAEINRNYHQSRIKKSDIDYHANELLARYKTPEGRPFDIRFRVSGNNVAFRYEIPRQNGGETGSMNILKEATGFRFPDYTTTFLTPQSDAMIAWKRTKPSYEEVYKADAPMNEKSQYGHGYTFPALFHVGDDGWVLLGETGVDSYFPGSRISDYTDGIYTIEYPMEEENNGNGSAWAAIGLPGVTPWRTITAASTLEPIVETTITWDLVEPKYEALVPDVHGKGTWSWIMWQDDSINYDDIKAYIDFAAEMGYQNTLIDCGWDKNIGKERLEELIRYGKERGVNCILWYSSSGWWNDIVQSPTDIMSRPIPRKEYMRWMRDNGVKAIKVDFFGGDKQETMRLYEDILSDANDYGLAVIFHGCTMPRGWERMYPNYVGSEAVLASENLMFQQSFCNQEAFNATLHPFIRNSLGAMEYGGTVLNKRFSRGNDRGNHRLTSDAFQLALAVLFQNPVQNFALAPNNLTDAPAEAIEFMKNVPTTWDDTRLIEGYPGKYVVLARKSGGRWYVAGVNGTDETIKLDLDLPMLDSNEPATMIADTPAPKGAKTVNDKGVTVAPVIGSVEKSTVNARKGRWAVTIAPSSGFVLMQ